MNAFAIDFAIPALGVPPGEELSFFFFFLGLFLFLGVPGEFCGDWERSSSLFGDFSGLSSAAAVAFGRLR